MLATAAGLTGTRHSPLIHHHCSTITDDDDDDDDDNVTGLLSVAGRHLSGCRVQPHRGRSKVDISVAVVYNLIVVVARSSSQWPSCTTSSWSWQGPASGSYTSSICSTGWSLTTLRTSSMSLTSPSTCALVRQHAHTTIDTTAAGLQSTILSHSTLRQWSFRGGTRGNAVPIVKIPLERMGTAFPLLSYGENAYTLLKMHFAVQKDVSLTLKYGKTRWQTGLRPRPRWGSLRSPRPPSRLGRGHPSPDITPLSAFGASILAPSTIDTPRLRRLEIWRSHCC